ncbi:MAG: beta-ketoacyl-[acyl-carrier-protein] synthase family protein [Deltaproteobacteria bacterium]|nr:beta-ketoacyl-[acyl-carrier-protein] synthase family protein [Deltaproteobacteria bacterium]
MRRRVVVTGMGVVTPLGDELGAFYQSLLAGRSAITRWKFFDDPRVYSKVGGDLSGYDAAARLQALLERIPEEHHARLSKLFRTAPMSTRLSLIVGLDGWLDAALGFGFDPSRAGVIVGGHNLNEHYLIRQHHVFMEEPDWMDAQIGVLDLDTDHAASIGEALGLRGPTYTMGGACASANLGLRAGLDEIRHHGLDVVLLAGACLDFSPIGLHAMALLGAISFQSFNDAPERASRPFDLHREGFVPSHGAAALVLEELEHARRRDARIYAEVLGCVATSDGSHLPAPSTEGQSRTIGQLLAETGVPKEEVDFVCAHATSTQLGDVSELRALHEVFGAHAQNLKINAPKSMLGHTCWSAPAVETVAAILQMRGGRLHPSINVEVLDPQIDLDVCANAGADLRPRHVLKNSFGFGGINCCSLLKPGPV